MGLRITTGATAMSALTTMQRVDGLMVKNIGRLSSGKRTQFAADAPNDVAIASSLSAQIKSLHQVANAASTGSNILALAEQNLSAISTELENVRASIIAANSGSSTTAIEQSKIDSALNNINRIANSTRYGSRSLLNGGAAAVDTTADPDIDVDVYRFDFKGQQTGTLSIVVSNNGLSAAHLSIGGVSGGTGGTLTITGNLGTATINVHSSYTATNLASQVNDVAAQTGVVMDSATGMLESVYAGNQQFVSISMSGSWTGVAAGAAATAGASKTDYGSSANTKFTVNGVEITNPQSRMEINTTDFSGVIDINLSRTTAATTGGPYALTLNNGGFSFDLGDGPMGINIPSLTTADLGSRTITATGGTGNAIGGKLSSLKSGSTNDLSTNATNALYVVDQAIAQVGQARAMLGSLDSGFFQPAVDSTSVSIDNLTSAKSKVEDLDFASEISDFTKNQVLFQASASILSSANQLPGIVLSLLS